MIPALLLWLSAPGVWHDAAMSIEDRVSALEAQLREQAALRAQQDGDLSGLTLGLRVANNLLQALALTQGDQTAVLAEHTRTLADHTRRLTDLDAGVKTIIEMLGTLIGRGDMGEGA